MCSVATKIATSLMNDPCPTRFDNYVLFALAITIQFINVAA